jgi:hypothetical protein
MLAAAAPPYTTISRSGARMRRASCPPARASRRRFHNSPAYAPIGHQTRQRIANTTGGMAHASTSSTRVFSFSFGSVSVANP